MENYKRKILSMFLVVVVILLSSYFLYIKLSEKKESFKEDSNISPNIPEIKLEKDVVLKYMKVLDNGLIYNENGTYKDFEVNNLKLYQTDKVLLSSSLQSSLLFDNIKASELPIEYALAVTFKLKYGNVCSNIDCMENGDSVNEIKLEEMKENYKEIFGSISTFEPTSFGIFGQNYYRYDEFEETFYLEKTQGEIDSSQILNRPLYYKTVKTNELIEIYAASVMIKDDLNGKIIFSNTNNTYSINSNILEYECNNHYDHCYYFANETFDEIKSKFDLYKYTFKKESSGNYYYFKTEKVS